jgi:nucleoside-diphosphate-sugar epimerase
MSRRVLVTGATGCIGRALLPRLTGAGWEVHATFRGSDAGASDGCSWHRVDLLAPRAGEQIVDAVAPDAIVHLAWYVAPRRWATAEENFDWVSATLALARAFAQHGGGRFIGAGSCLEYDWNYGYCSERRTPCAPHTAYGTCKNATRELLAALAAQTKISLAWPRVFFLYGPHEHPERLVAYVVRSLLDGQEARTSHGRQVRDYLFVDDVADVFARLVEGSIEGPVNVGSGQAVTLKTIVERIGAIVGRPDLLRLGTIPSAATDKPLVVADVDRLENEIGWRPAIDLDEGLRRTIEWWRHQGRGAVA